jgi:hypothetical protein
MFAVVAAGLTQPRPRVTLADATLREDEAAAAKFLVGANLILNFTFS